MQDDLQVPTLHAGWTPGTYKMHQVVLDLKGAATCTNMHATRVAADTVVASRNAVTLTTNGAATMHDAIHHWQNMAWLEALVEASVTYEASLLVAMPR